MPASAHAARIARSPSTNSGSLASPRLQYAVSPTPATATFPRSVRSAIAADHPTAARGGANAGTPRLSDAADAVLQGANADEPRGLRRPGAGAARARRRTAAGVGWTRQPRLAGRRGRDRKDAPRGRAGAARHRVRHG